MSNYTDDHARAGVDAKLSSIETWPNQYPSYTIKIEIPEYTSVCPKTGLPDHGKITIEYEPDKLCAELKSLKMYLLEYRNLGIFYENAVNKMKYDLVETMQPVWLRITGEFTPRGGINSTISSEYRRDS